MDTIIILPIIIIVFYFIMRAIILIFSQKDVTKRAKAVRRLSSSDIITLIAAIIIAILLGSGLMYEITRYSNISDNISLILISTSILAIVFVLQAIYLSFYRKFFVPNLPLDEMVSHKQTNTISSPIPSPIAVKQPTTSPVPTKPQIPTIFLSYRRSDSNDISGRIYDRLIQAMPREYVFKDVDSIPFGIDFREYLAEMIQKCDIVLAVIGSDWVDVKDSNGRRRLDDTGDFVRIEIEEALQRKIRVIPLLVRGASMPQEMDLPERLKPLAFRNGISVRPDPDFHNDMNRLLRDLNLLQ